MKQRRNRKQAASVKQKPNKPLLRRSRKLSSADNGSGLRRTLALVRKGRFRPMIVRNISRFDRNCGGFFAIARACRRNRRGYRLPSIEDGSSSE
jgi:hypothetical protein